MGQELAPEDRELHRRCDEVLHYVWDPIGVSEVPAARDEYQGYLPRLFAIVRNAPGVEPLVDYLSTVERDSMGLTPNREGLRHVAQLLLAHRDWINEQNPRP